MLGEVTEARKMCLKYRRSFRVSVVLPCPVIKVSGKLQQPNPGRHATGGAERSASLSEGCQQNTAFQAARMKSIK